MKWTETVASKCRYGYLAARLFGDAEIIWEDSEDDYQGHADVLAALPDGRFAHYSWTYGSCSGCDEWEDRGLDDDQIEQEMRNATAFLTDRSTVKRYLKLEGEFADARVPSANGPTNGSVPGMLYMAFGGFQDSFKAMGEAFLRWLEQEGKG